MAVKLTLGPVLFNWPAEKLRAFYAGIARSVFERVVIGEVVCGKRMPFTDPLWPEIIDLLGAAGKEVVPATLALGSSVRERKAMAELAAGDQPIELSDVSALPHLAGRPFHVGPLVNIYNEGAARFFAARGAASICLPVELSLAAAAVIAAACPTLEIELFAFGRLPLAVSGRCYHARHHGLHKDSCQFVCDRDADGLAVDTLDGQPFLAINGIQTLSQTVHVWCPTDREAAAHGIARLRLSPQDCDMVRIGEVFRARLDDALSLDDARIRLAAIGLPSPMVDGYTHGLAGHRLVEPEPSISAL